MIPLKTFAAIAAALALAYLAGIAAALYAIPRLQADE